MNFLYFIPGSRITSLNHIPDEWELKKTFDGVGANCDVAGDMSGQKGPGGAGGYLFCPHPASAEGKRPQFGYFPDRQTWAPVRDRTDDILTHYLGFEEKPRAVDLQRTQENPGRISCDPQRGRVADSHSPHSTHDASQGLSQPMRTGTSFSKSIRSMAS